MKTYLGISKWPVGSRLGVAAAFSFSCCFAVLAQHSVSLKWNPSPDTNVVVGYIIRYGPASGSCTNLSDVGNHTSTTISNLQEGQTYYFVAIAYDYEGRQSLPSNQVSYTVPASIPDQTIAEDTVLGPLSFKIGDVETPAASLTLAGSSSSPTLVPSANIVFGLSGSNHTVAITPAPNLYGSSTITITVRDSDGASVSQSFLFTVISVNDWPTLDPIPDVTLNENAGLQLVSLTGISSGAPNENQVLTITALSSDPGVVPDPTVNYANGNTTGSLRFAPVPHAAGTALIAVTVDDGGSSHNLTRQTFVVTVKPVNYPPTISDIPAQVTAEDTPVVIPFVVSDPELLPMRLTLSASATNSAVGTLAGMFFEGYDSNRTLRIVPGTNWFGPNLITIAASDGTNTARKSFVLTVNPVNDPPTLDPLNDLALVGGRSLPDTTVTLTGITPGPANETQTLTVTASSSNTSLIINPTVTYTSPNPNGTIAFKPSNNKYGTSVLTVTVSDGTVSLARSFTVYVRNSGNNSAVPTISAISNRTIAQNTNTGPLSFTVGDSQTPAASLIVTAWSSNTNLVPTNSIVFGGSDSSRTVTVTPLPKQSGSATITLSVTDANFGMASASFVLTVTAANDPPVISHIPNQTTLEDASLGPIPFTVGDVQTAAASLTVSASSTNQTLIPNASIVLGGNGTNRALLITPAANQSGTSLISVTVSDGTASATDTFLVTVIAVNDPPTLDLMPDLTVGINTGLQIVSLTGIAPGAPNEIQALTAKAHSSNPALIPDPVVNYVDPLGSGSLSFAPAANASGLATIYVTVQDNGGTNNGGQDTVTRSFEVTVETLAPPSLSIALIGTNVVVSWSNPSEGYVLQRKAAFGPGQFWSAVDQAPQVVGSVKMVALPANQPGEFYRLVLEAPPSP